MYFDQLEVMDDQAKARWGTHSLHFAQLTVVSQYRRVKAVQWLSKVKLFNLENTILDLNLYFGILIFRLLTFLTLLQKCFT